MNVFATLKTVFFGSKFLSSPVSTEETLTHDLVSALKSSIFINLLLWIFLSTFVMIPY